MKNDLLVLNRQEYPSGVFAPIQSTSNKHERSEKSNMEWTRGGEKSAFLLMGACVGRDRIKTNDATETKKGGRLRFKGKQETFLGAAGWGCHYILYTVIHLIIKILIALFRNAWLQIATITTRSGFLGYAY